jgi:dTDP-4-amino-4,6-dideoxygalactose transaminase
MDQLMAIAKANNLFVVEDGCHAPSGEFNNQKLGSIGDIGTFSFFSNKNISTGEGGMLVTNNEAIYNKAKLLRSHGMTSMSYQRASGQASKYEVLELGYNYRMDDMRASIGLAQLDKLDNDLEKRVKVRNWYLEALEKLNDQVIIPFKDREDFSTNYVFPIVLRNSDGAKRDKVRQFLHDEGIQTSVHYPSVHLFEIYQHLNYHLPKTEYVTSNVITLPMHGGLEKETVDFIVDNLNSALNG